MKQFVAGLVAVSALGVAATAAPPAGDAATVHVLNRVAYGPRPGEVERMRTTGIQRYIESQLRPMAIPDPAIEGHLLSLTTLRMSLSEIVDSIERPQIEARRARKQ